VIYALITRGTVLVIHAFKKTTQQLGADANTTEGGSVMKRMRRSSPARLARQLSIPKSRGLEAVLKAQLVAASFARLAVADSPTRTWPDAPGLHEVR